MTCATMPENPGREKEKTPPSKQKGHEKKCGGYATHLRIFIHVTIGIRQVRTCQVRDAREKERPEKKKN